MLRPNRDPIDVMFVMAAYTMGGMELQLAALINARPAWARHLNLEMVTFLPSESEEVEARFRSAGVKSTLIDRSTSSFPGFFWKLYRHMRSVGPKVVHTQLDASAGTWGRMAALLAKVPSIIQSDLSLMVGGTRTQRMLRPYLDARTQLFLPNANAIAERIINGGAPEQRVQMLMPGVDLTRFSPDTETPGRPGSEAGLVAGFLGRFDPVKRIDVLLSALTALPISDRPARVLLAGDGPLRPQIEAQIAADKWLTDNCELVGRQDDVPAFLRRIDYLVHPSEIEGMPNAILEAMAMAKPIVATRVSDIPLVVGDAGILVEPGDSSSLATGIATMQGLRAEDRANLGARARRKIEDDHDLEKVAARFWNLHMDLISHRNRRAGGGRAD